MKTYVVNTSTCFKKKSLISDTSKRVCTIFRLTVNISCSVVFVGVFTGLSCFFRQSLEHFMKKLGNLPLFFLFRRRVLFLTKKNLANQASNKYYNLTHCSRVRFRKLFQSSFSEKYHKFKKATGANQKPIFERKAIPSDQETSEFSPFLGRFWSPLFHTRSLLNIRYHPFNKVEEWFCNRSFFVKKFF